MHPVLFSVAEEYIRIKGISDLLGEFIPNQYGGKEFFQLYLVAYRSYVMVVFIKILKIAEPICKKSFNAASCIRGNMGI